MPHPQRFSGESLVSWSDLDITISVPWYLGLMFRTRKEDGVLMEAVAGASSRLHLQVRENRVHPHPLPGQRQGRCATEGGSPSSQAACTGPRRPGAGRGPCHLPPPLCLHRPGGVPSESKKGNTSLLSQQAAQSRHSWAGRAQGIQHASTVPTGGSIPALAFFFYRRDGVGAGLAGPMARPLGCRTQSRCVLDPGCGLSGVWHWRWWRAPAGRDEGP